MPDELDQLFEDPELRRLAGSISRAARLEVDADPAFRSELRRRLLREAYDRREPGLSFWRRLLSPPGLAWAGAAVGTLLIAAVAVSLLANPAGTTTVLVGCSCASAQAMSLAQPIELSFSQPMDQQSVEKSISISPATSVSYQWTSPTTIKIVPVAGDLAPNTQYQLRISAAAATAAGQQLGRQQTITFTTQPPPSPAPSPSPSASPPPPVNGEKALAALGSPAWHAWSPDGATLYLLGPGGSLEAIPSSGGPAKLLVPDGVSLAALAGQGDQLAYYRGGRIFTLDTAGLKVTEVATPGSPVQTLAWNASAPVWIEDAGAFSPGGRLAWSPPPGSTSAAISSAGAIAYLSGRTLSVHDPQQQKDLTLTQSATSFAWTRKGLLFTDDSGLQLNDLTGSSKLLAAQLTASSGLAESSHGQVLVAFQGGLYSVLSNGTGFQQLASGDYSDLQPSPAGTLLAFSRNGQLWTASLSPAVVPPLPHLDPAQGWKLLSDYLAPKVGTGDDVKLSRWFAVYSEPVPGNPPGLRFEVRLVYAKGGVESAYADQSITVSQTSDGKPSVQAGTAGLPRKAGVGPEVLSLSVSGGQVRIGFDSDLDPSTIGSGVTLSQGGGVVPVAASYDASGRAIVLSGTLKPGATVTLQVTGVRDVLGRTLEVPYSLSFTTPALSS